MCIEQPVISRRKLLTLSRRRRNLLPVNQQSAAALRRELGVGAAAGKRRKFEAVDTEEVDGPDALGRNAYRAPEVVDRREVACRHGYEGS